ncbi:hypothetical protein FC84_GL000418 [Lapidilactobacillus dextrinicus DSM 20335]|uniref:DUF3290 domain-containing protein n=1 Tax=Lapidilactobacillus dextrinicus DSM 20335 TaxID=1423738 RepID=A0A0R2BHE1_9LACO|nr:DUF3290 domain-containing protein [Lapidilactobacillus dextrinicus]KRM78618.1 hypothetical protein FC84_GL000418 [Lapidilactobacillus dextrinicus DSM 20335]QFG46545.1 DUF3290 domain-containing protein [Lapidilactobacillus dextrinicus]
MTFYGIHYLEAQSNITDYLKYFMIFGSLIVLVIFFSLYLRHRIQTKYRDLSIIFLLLLLFALGVQYSDYRSNQAQHSQSSQMVNFVRNVAADKQINNKEVLVNATQLADGVIVKIKDDYYKVNLSQDQSSYTLNRAHLMNDQITVNK